MERQRGKERKGEEIGRERGKIVQESDISSPCLSYFLFLGLLFLFWVSLCFFFLFLSWLMVILQDKILLGRFKLRGSPKNCATLMACTPCTGLSKGKAAQNFAILPRFDHPMFTPLISMLTIAGDIQTRISSEVSIPNSRSVVHILGGNFFISWYRIHVIYLHFRDSAAPKDVFKWTSYLRIFKTTWLQSWTFFKLPRNSPAMSFFLFALRYVIKPVSKSISMS